jgi:CRP-like cAMP-binding protein
MPARMLNASTRAIAVHILADAKRSANDDTPGGVCYSLRSHLHFTVHMHRSFEDFPRGRCSASIVDSTTTRERTMEPPGHRQNRFLKSLSATDFEALRPDLKVVDLPEDLTLIRVGDTVTNAYFPHTATISLIVEFEGGERVEVALIGSDSVLGAFSALGKPIGLMNAIVLLPGEASAIEMDRLRAAAHQSLALRERLERHGQALFVQAQQSAGCNAVHAVEARLARWLLRVRDLCGENQFKLTQEVMAHMIGARRNSVSMVAHALQQKNFIRYSRGNVQIIDLDGLRRTACECYAAVRDQYARLEIPE